MSEDRDNNEAKWLIEDVPGKPEDWPCNLREAKIYCVWQRIRDFYKNPNPAFRDLMLREAFCRQRGDLPSVGPRYRVSGYEVLMLKRIYLAGCCFNSWTLKLFVYHVVMEWIDSDRFYENNNRRLPIDQMVITESRKRKDLLPLQLRLFYEAYYECCEDWASRRFGVILYNVCAKKLEQKHNNQELWEIEHAIVSLMYDISGNLGTDRDYKLSLNRDEISKLIEIEASVLHKRKQSIMSHPLKGTLMIQLSNLILKSRIEGPPTRVYKYIKECDLVSAFMNKQIWLRDIRDLNDHYEGVVANEVVDSVLKDNPLWAKNLKSAYKKRFYVACYSRQLKAGKLDERYGECVLGYYGDRLVDFIAPLYWRTENMPWTLSGRPEAFPMFSQIAVLDVIYDKEEARKEMEYLVQCIDKLGQTDSQKRRFLNEILQYWKLSFKDAVNRDVPHEKWHEEKERRYVIFHEKGYDYSGSFIDKDRKLKFETTAMIAPDFILGRPSGEIRSKVSDVLKEVYECATFPDYYICNRCFAKGVFPDGFVGACAECGSRSVTTCRTKRFHFAG